jgi:hypothetical protein
VPKEVRLKPALRVRIPPARSEQLKYALAREPLADQMAVEPGAPAFVGRKSRASKAPVQRGRQQQILVNVCERLIERALNDIASDAGRRQTLAHSKRSPSAACRLESGNGPCGTPIVNRATLDQARHGGGNGLLAVTETRQALSYLLLGQIAPGQHPDGVVVGRTRHSSV